MLCGHQECEGMVRSDQRIIGGAGLGEECLLLGSRMRHPVPPNRIQDLTNPRRAYFLAFFPQPAACLLPRIPGCRFRRASGRSFHGALPQYTQAPAVASILAAERTRSPAPWNFATSTP